MRLIYTPLLAFFLVLFAGCKSQQWPYDNLQGGTNLETLLVVDLQTGYNGENVTLWIEEENVAEKLDAKTIPESSFTGIKVSFYKGVGNLLPEIIHVFDSNRNNVDNSPIEIGSEVTIKIRVERLDNKVIEQSIRVKLAEGRYIGLSLSGAQETIFVRQSRQPFNYL